MLLDLADPLQPHERRVADQVEHRRRRSPCPPGARQPCRERTPGSRRSRVEPRVDAGASRRFGGRIRFVPPVVRAVEGRFRAASVPAPLLGGKSASRRRKSRPDRLSAADGGHGGHYHRGLRRHHACRYPCRGQGSRAITRKEGQRCNTKPSQEPHSRSRPSGDGRHRHRGVVGVSSTTGGAVPVAAAVPSRHGSAVRHDRLHRARRRHLPRRGRRSRRHVLRDQFRHRKHLPR